MRVGIVGVGRVGCSVAAAALQSGLARELLLYDIDTDRARAEALDLGQGAAWYPTAVVRAADLGEMAQRDVVIVAAGRSGAPGQTRRELIEHNRSIPWEVGRGLEGAEGVVIVVTNPVDAITQAITEASGLPASRVIGTGTLLDTYRMRSALAPRLGMHVKSVHIDVIGEHGECSVPLWSSAHAAGTRVRDTAGWSLRRELDLTYEVAGAAQKIIGLRGHSHHAPAWTAVALLQAIGRDERRVLTVSRVQEGAGGVRDVALSLPTVVGAGGAIRVVEPPMDESEREALNEAARQLSEVPWNEAA